MGSLWNGSRLRYWCAGIVHNFQPQFACPISCPPTTKGLTGGEGDLPGGVFHFS